MKNKIWVIDDNDAQLKTSVSLLQKVFPEFQMVPLLPLPTLGDYAPTLLSDPETACVFIDQKLKEKGTAQYYGTELASHLRAIDTKLPLYILTNYVDEKELFEEGEKDVEDIIDKGKISDKDSDYIQNLKARLIRRIDNYNDILTNRERRFRELLLKSLVENLSVDETAELKELQGIRGAGVAAIESALLERIAKTVELYEEKLAKYEH
jgi:hypothetical protein